LALKDGFTRDLERKRSRALNILSLSGGGQNGAFGPGFLVGWRESGQRPEFDMVGGVSTGALLATRAFLGTPVCKPALKCDPPSASNSDPPEKGKKVSFCA